MKSLLIGAVAFAGMEPLTALVHRHVMHGVGWVLHRSHHEAQVAKLEANDAYPVMFAGVTMVGFAAGTTLPSLAWLVPTAVGVTCYGAAYAFVHDVYTHGRLGRLPTLPVLEWLKESHRIHHLYGEAPYGMLVPVVPARLRRRAEALRHQGAAADESFSEVGDGEAGVVVPLRRDAPVSQVG